MEVNKKKAKTKYQKPKIKVSSINKIDLLLTSKKDIEMINLLAMKCHWESY